MKKQSEAEFLKSYDASAYDRPSVTVDMVIFTVADAPPQNYRKLPEKQLQILLIQRGKHPFRDHWALPGGFVGMNETLDQAAARELAEETGVRGVYMEQLYTWGDPGRDPRTRVISCSYMALIDAARIRLAAGDDAADARWFTIQQPGTERQRSDRIAVETNSAALSGHCATLRSRLLCLTSGEIEITAKHLAFDHARIIRYALDRLRNKLDYTDIAFHLLPKHFTLTQLQQVYETILGHALLKPNFRRQMKHRIIDTGQLTDAVGHRPSRLFKVNR